MSVLLRVHDLSLSFGGIKALQAVSLEVREGDICAVIGPNGAGKTSLFNCISQLYKPSGGSIELGDDELIGMPPHRIAKMGVARTFQHTALLDGLSVEENVLAGALVDHPVRLTLQALGTRAYRRSEAEAKHRCDYLLEQLGLEACRTRSAQQLPMGTLKRIELARALMSRPRLLMLDEPANGLTHQEVDELGKVIRSLRDEFKLTVLLVEHHMGMVTNISDQVHVLAEGKNLFSGVPSDVLAHPKVISAYLGAVA